MVRRKMFCSLVVVFFAVMYVAADLPDPVGWVNDFADVISQENEDEIAGLVELVEKVTTVEIAVLTIKSFAPYSSIEEYSLKIANEWGVGNRDKNNGILLVMSLKERRVRIEIGLGLEELISDDAAGVILDNWVLPSFREDRYANGFKAAVEAIARIILLDQIERDLQDFLSKSIDSD